MAIKWKGAGCTNAFMLMNASLELLWVNKFPSSRESVPSYFRAALFFRGKNEAKRQATVIESKRWMAKVN